jgi:hypothetical protein
MLKNWTPNPIRVVARDRRSAAVHEAGHLVIARMLSIKAQAHIYYKVENEDFDLLAEKTWSGQTCTPNESPDRRERSMIAVAGAVAELCWRGELVDEYYWFERNIMSETDWRGTQCVPGEPDETCFEAKAAVTAVLERGASQWNNLVRTARKLIVSSRRIEPVNVLPRARSWQLGAP